MYSAPDRPPALDAARVMRARADARDARERVHRAHGWLCFMVLGQVVLMLLTALARSGSSGRAGAHEGVGYLAVIGFGVAQYVCVYRLSRALGEPRPWMRLGSMVLPFAALSVVFAIHSKALRRLRHG